MVPVGRRYVFGGSTGTKVIDAFALLTLATNLEKVCILDLNLR